MIRLKWKLVLVRLEVVRILTQIGAWFALDVPQAQKSFWMNLMVPLGDEAQVEACFGSFGDRVNLDAR